jgi:hypothetical protein
MRFRVGLVIGFATGYVLGTKAGRERYDQIRDATKGIWASQAGQQVREAAHQVVDQAARVVGAAREPGEEDAEAAVYTTHEGGNGRI